MATGRRGLFACAGGLALVLAHWLALFHRAVLGGETFFARDITPFHKPLLRLAARLWRETAGLPLWDPYLAWGQPWAANPNAAPFHPLTLLTLVTDERTALVANIALPPLLGVAAMLFFLRSRGCRPAAALYGGLVWGFGGYLLSATNLFATLRTAAVLPAALGFAVRISRTGRPGHVVGLAATGSLVFAGGEPTVVVAFLAALGAVLLEPVRLGRQETAAVVAGAPTRRILRTGLGLGLALAAAAVFVFPAVGLARRTIRVAPLPAAEWSSYAFAPPRLLEPISPHLLGTVDFTDPEGYWGSGWYGSRRLPFLGSVYMGLLTAVLALVSVRRGGRRERVWAAVGTGGIIVALSGHFPSWLGFIFRAPPLGQLRYTEKWAVLPVLAAIVLAAHALDRILAGEGRHRREALLGLAGAAAIVVAIAATQAAGPSSSAFRAALGITSARAAHAAAAAAPQQAALGIGLAAAYSICLWFLQRRPRGGVALLLLITSVDLYRTGRPLVPTALHTRVDAPPAIIEPLLRRDPPPRLFHLAEWQPACAGLSGAGWPLEPAGWGVPVVFERDFDVTQLAWSNRATRRFRDLITTNPDLLVPGLLRRGVEALAYCTVGAGSTTGSAATAAGNPVALRLLRGARPDLFCAAHVALVDGDAGWMETARRIGDAAPRWAIVDRGSLPAGIDVPSEPFPCAVRLIAMSPGRLDAEVAAVGPGASVLAINQTWDDRWAVTLDGRPQPLLRAETSLSALVIPPGTHRLALRYHDSLVTISLAVSLTTVVALAAASLVLLRRRKRTGIIPGRRLAS